MSKLIKGIATKIKEKTPKNNNIEGLGLIRCFKNITNAKKYLNLLT